MLRRRWLLLVLLLGGCVRATWTDPARRVDAGPGAEGGSGDRRRDVLLAGERSPVGSGALPVVTAFSVTSAAGKTLFAAGDPVSVSFSVEDAEGLASAPVQLSLSTDGRTWQPVVERFGALTDNPKQWTGSYSALRAPGTAFFRLRIIAWDAAGQGSVPVLSDALNAGAWSVYAGSNDRGVGSSGRAAALRYSTNPTIPFALSPTTGDLLAIDDGSGVVRLDAKTGLTSLLIRPGPRNLPDDGPLPSSPTLDSVDALVFDSKGRLYLSSGTNHDARLMVLYQVDLAAGHVRRYLGGGTVFDGSATPSTVASTWGPVAFDEESTLYFLATCSPAGWNEASSTVRLMKATQTPDGTAGTVSVVAGNCVAGTAPTGPVDAKSAPLGSGTWINAGGSIAVWNRGATIYLGLYATPVTKILNGQLYATAIEMTAESVLLHDPARGRLYAADGAIRAITPSLAGPKGETSVIHAGGAAYAPGCDADGATAAAACLVAKKTLLLAPDGRLLFIDGVSENSDTSYRVRSLDPDGRVRTLMGSRSFVGEGLDRRVVRGYPAGLAYKSALQPGQALFGSGLYIMEHGGPVLLGVGGDGKPRALWGNQVAALTIHPTGTPIGPGLSLGKPYFGGDGEPLAFDDEGLPWVRYNGVLARVDASGKIVRLQDRSVENCWNKIPDGADPAKYGVIPYGARANLALKGSGVFLIGNECGETLPVTIRYLDFASHVATRLMGKLPDGYSPDNATPGSVKNLSVSDWCFDGCHLVYRRDQDRLYFSERERLRYITAPTSPASSTLGTVFTTTERIHNFVFTPDGKQLLYLKGGVLRCHDLGSDKSWCNDTPLGPPAELGSIVPLPNQLVFEDPGHLLVSNGRGEVLRFTLPP